jgi:hypothetical protein
MRRNAAKDPVWSRVNRTETRLSQADGCMRSIILYVHTICEDPNDDRNW